MLKQFYLQCNHGYLLNIVIYIIIRVDLPLLLILVSKHFIFYTMVDTRAKIISHYLSGSTPTEILTKLKVDKVNRMLVYRTIKRYKDTQGMTDRPRSGRPPTARAIRLRKAVRSRIARNSKRSMRKMAKELGVNRESLRKLVRYDLGLKSLKRKTVHHLTPALRQK